MWQVVPKLNTMTVKSSFLNSKIKVQFELQSRSTSATQRWWRFVWEVGWSRISYSITSTGPYRSCAALETMIWCYLVRFGWVDLSLVWSGFIWLCQFRVSQTKKKKNGVKYRVSAQLKNAGMVMQHTAQTLHRNSLNCLEKRNALIYFSIEAISFMAKIYVITINFPFGIQLVILLNPPEWS